MKPNRAAEFDQKAFRRALGCFATGVTVVTTVRDGREPVGLTVNSFCSVSLDPPLVLFCLDRKSYNHDTFRSAGYFAVNVLSEEQKKLAVRFARTAADKWRGIRYTRGETGSPVIEGALAVFECATENVHEAGDHIILVGRVRRIEAEAEGRPLLFFRGKYNGITNDFS